MNQNPEQLAIDKIDSLLQQAGWVVQSKTKINLAAATGVAVREYQTDIGPADYALFVYKRPVLLTATPDNRTFGYFDQNLVSNYNYEKAVIDGVLVPYNEFTIETKIIKEGSTIAIGKIVDRRERLTRRKFWETMDEDLAYSRIQLDKDILKQRLQQKRLHEIKVI